MPTPPASSRNKRRLGEIMIDAGLLDELQLKSALGEQRKWGGRLGRTLVEMGFVKEDAMVRALSEQLSLPAVDLDGIRLPHSALEMLRVDLAERYGVVPLEGDPKKKTLSLATSDPTNQEMLKEIEFHTGMRITISVAGSLAIDRAIRREYYGDETPPPGPEDRTQPMEVVANGLVHDLDGSPVVAVGAQAAPPAPAAQAAPQASAALEARLAEMTQRMTEMERTLASQTRVLRTIVELLFEKGVVTREDYLNKVRGPQAS